MSLAHKHLILKGRLKRAPLGSQQIEQALRDLVELVGMKILADPRARYSNEPGNSGFTGDVLLTTSHMMWHDWNAEAPGESDLQFDLYSCAPFDQARVIEFLRSEFGLHDYTWRLFDREYDLIDIGSGGQTSLDNN